MVETGQENRGFRFFVYVVESPSVSNEKVYIHTVVRLSNGGSITDW